MACEEPEPPALSVGPVEYTAGELGALSNEQRERLALLTAFGVLVADGDTDSLVTLLARQEQRSLLLPLLAGEAELRRTGTSEEELRAAYLRDPEVELVVRHLVVLAEQWRSDDFRREARGRAEAALARIRRGADFVMVAREVSEEPGAESSGGLLAPGREGDWVPPFWTAAEGLEEGEVSGVVETQYGFHVLKLVERRAIPLSEVRARSVLRVMGPETSRRALAALGDSLAAEVRVERPALEAWLAGAPDGSVATWPDGALSADELSAYAATLSPLEWRRLRAASADAASEVVRAVARGERLASVADAWEVRLDPASANEVEAGWSERVTGWAAALGFRADLEPETVREAAMAALVADRQSTAIARSAVLEHGPALRWLVEIEDRTTGGADAGRASGPGAAG